MPRPSSTDLFSLEGLESRVLLSGDPILLPVRAEGASDAVISAQEIVQADDVFAGAQMAGLAYDAAGQMESIFAGVDTDEWVADAPDSASAPAANPASNPASDPTSGLDLDSTLSLSTTEPTEPTELMADVSADASVETPAPMESVVEQGADAAVSEVISAGTPTVAAALQASPESPAEALPQTSPDPSSAGPSVTLPLVGVEAWAEQLTETLHGANGPPAASANEESGPSSRVLVDGEVFGGQGSANLHLINESGVVTPGNSPGVMNVASYTQGAEGVEVVEITGWNANNNPVRYDQIIASGNVTLDGTLKIDLSGFTPVVGQTYPILKWGGVRVGQFAKYLGTTVPGNNQLALVPEYDDVARELRLRVVNTEAVIPEVERTLQDIADLADDLLNFSAPGATDLWGIGSSIQDLFDAKQMVEDTIQDRIAQLINTLPTQAQVTKALEGLGTETFGPFTVEVTSVLGRYSQPGDLTTFYAWDVQLAIRETTVTEILSDGLNAIFDVAFGAGSEVTLENRLELDFSFGIDDSDSNPLTPNAFVDLRSITPRVKVVASDINPLALTPGWLVGNPLTNISSTASITLEAFIQFAPDPNLFPPATGCRSCPRRCRTSPISSRPRAPRSMRRSS
jgi:hypothetical protein